MSHEISEFTKKAMQQARDLMQQEEDSEPEIERETKRHSVKLYLSEADLKLLYRLLDLGLSKSREAITRCKRFPTDSIRSRMTIERHEGIIDHIDTLRDHITEESQW